MRTRIWLDYDRIAGSGRLQHHSGVRCLFLRSSILLLIAHTLTDSLSDNVWFSFCGRFSSKERTHVRRSAYRHVCILVELERLKFLGFLQQPKQAHFISRLSWFSTSILFSYSEIPHLLQLSTIPYTALCIIRVNTNISPPRACTCQHLET